MKSGFTRKTIRLNGVERDVLVRTWPEGTAVFVDGFWWTVAAHPMDLLEVAIRGPFDSTGHCQCVVDFMGRVLDDEPGPKPPRHCRCTTCCCEFCALDREIAADEAEHGARRRQSQAERELSSPNMPSTKVH